MRYTTQFLLSAMVVIFALTVTAIGCGGSHSSSTPAAPTMTATLTVSNAAPALNTPVTLKATLSNSAATGAVSFQEGTNLLGCAPVSNGAATLTTSSLPIGTGTLTAAYSGNSTYPAATSTGVTVDVTLASAIVAQAVDTAAGNFAQQTVNLTVK